MGLKHQAAIARKWRSAARRVGAHFPPHLPPLLFLTDPERTPNPNRVASSLPRGSGVIYRHFGAADREQIAAELRATCSARGLVLLIAADPDLAVKVAADGVHWPEARLTESRTCTHAFQVQTASAHGRSAILAAAQAGMDAAIVSTVFPSRSPSARRAIGPARFRSMAQAAEIPVYGLGGLNAQNADQISDFAGIAAIGGFLF